MWNSGERENSIVVSESGLYAVEAEKDGCLRSDSVKINIVTCITCRIFIPTAVSPNLDNINEKLELFSNCAIEKPVWQIFDRWGALEYNGFSARTDWPTTQTAPGIYVYKLSYIDPGDQKAKLIAGEILVIK